MHQLNIQNIETLHNSLVELRMQLEKASSAQQIQNIRFAINATMRTIQQNDAVATHFYGHNREACHFWNQLHQAGFAPSLIPQLSLPQPAPVNQTFYFNPRVFISNTTTAASQSVAHPVLQTAAATKPKQLNEKVKKSDFDAKKCATNLPLHEQNILIKMYEAHLRDNKITTQDLAMHFDLTEELIHKIKISLLQKSHLTRKYRVSSKGCATAKAIQALREEATLWVQRPLLPQRNLHNKRALEAEHHVTNTPTHTPIAPTNMMSIRFIK